MTDIHSTHVEWSLEHDTERPEKQDRIRLTVTHRGLIVGQWYGDYGATSNVDLCLIMREALTSVFTSYCAIRP
jgi:hypothetical protein